MNIRFLTLLTTLAFLGLCVSVPTFAGKEKNCDPPDPHPSCEDSTLYTAELTAGAFRFAEVDGNITIIDIDVTPISDQNTALVSVYDDDVEMWRPTNFNEQATWDRMFAIGCPELVPVNGTIDKILSKADDWDFHEPGNIRLILRDIRLIAVGDVAWDVTMQLIGPANYSPNGGIFLPPDGVTHVFELEQGRIWGREVRGGPGGRKSCSSSAFYLCEQASLEGTCEEDDVYGYDASAVMEIVNPEG